MEPVRPAPVSVADLSLQRDIKKPPSFDGHVQQSTGHHRYLKREDEAQFILDQFDMNYRPQQLRKGLRGRILSQVRERLDQRPNWPISPDLLFNLRLVYHRSKKLMDDEGLPEATVWCQCKPDEKQPAEYAGAVRCDNCGKLLAEGRRC